MKNTNVKIFVSVRVGVQGWVSGIKIIIILLY